MINHAKCSEISDKPKEECGVFGVYDKSGSVGDVVASTYYGLYALQHRGQESCGMAINDMGVITKHRDIGLVNEVFTKDVLEKMPKGQMSVGHCRYSTTGSISRNNAQPLVIQHIKGSMALAHNGSVTNAAELREEIELSGGIFHATSDTEAIAYTIIKQRLTTATIEQAVEQAMYKLKGAYCLIVMSPRKMIAARDPSGYRPLCMGSYGDSVVFASESCALDAIGAKFVRDIEPGEIVVVSDDGVKSIKTHCGQKTSFCVFEYIYFARPDSVINGQSVHESRILAGKYLAKSHPVNADIVIGVPDSGLDAALGYSQESGIPYGIGFLKNRYIGRTFIAPNQKQRENDVRIKLNAIKSVVNGKRVVMIDDSIVRGTTSLKIVKLLREAGATQVHMRLSSPPFRHPCYFGTDIDSRENLIAHNNTIEEIAKKINVDTLGYLNESDLASLAPNMNYGICSACFTGKYNTPIPKNTEKNKFEQKIKSD